MNKSVEDYLNEVSYVDDIGYIPSEYSLKFVNFIKLVNGKEGEENKTPVVHYKLLDNVFSGKQRLAILCHRGFAKALALDELVYTPQGPVDIARLSVGDDIYGEDGKLTKVLDKSPIFYKDMYLITLEDGRKIKVSEDHINTIIHRRQVRLDGVRTWIEERKDVTTTELTKLAINHKRKPSSKNPKGKENRVWIPLCKPIEYPEKELSIDPYTLGLLLGDGSFDKVTGYARLHAHKDDIGHYISKIPYPLGKQGHKAGTNCDYIGVLGLGKRILEHSLGVRGDYKFIPEEYMYSSVNQRLAMLQGLMDTDGTVGKCGGCSFTSNSFLLAKGVMELVRSLGGIASLGTTGNAFRVGVNLNLPVFSLPRKLDRQTFKSKQKVAIVNIERIDKEPSQCIRVDNSTSTFVTTDYVVTHNSTLLSEYLPLYCAVFGKLEVFGEVSYMLFIGDSLENGCRNMRKNMENRYNQSEFLQKYLPKARFTDTMIEFTNLDGKQFAIRLAGAQQSIRGTRYLNRRPELCIMDDILTDQDAKSPTCIANINNTIHRGVDKALHPTHKKVIYVGTCYNANDPLYRVIESGRWSPSVFPVCEEFPVSKEEFRGSWPERFPYEAVKAMYDDAISLGRLGDFNVEMMNRVMSSEDRLVDDSDLMWYSRRDLLKRPENYNFYITTDFSTSEKASADFSVISVWAVNNRGYRYYVDGVCKRQTLDKALQDLFRLVQIYNPLSVGIEVTGQQQAFINWIQKEMMDKNIFFNLASTGREVGIRPTKQKFVRFVSVVPWFKQKIMYFPEEMRTEAPMVELLTELSLISAGGVKSKHDDMVDTVSMLGMMDIWNPSGENTLTKDDTGIWVEDVVDSVGRWDSYIV